MANKGIPTAAARRLLKEKGPELVERYEAGESYASIARSLGVSKAAVSSTVRRNGGVPRGRGAYSFPGMMDRARQVRERYEGGESLNSIAADLDVSFTVARNDLLAAGGKTLSMRGFKAKPLRGPENPAWRGGSHLNREGYRLVWLPRDDPMASMSGSRMYVFEHRLVMARAIGRPLLKSETVHHINGDKLDNRPENLQLRSAAHGPGVQMRCCDCGSRNVEAVEL